MISLVSIVVAATSATSAIIQCADDRQAAARKSKREGKSRKSTRSRKSSKARSSKSARSGASRKGSASKSGRSRKSARSSSRRRDASKKSQRSKSRQNVATVMKNQRSEPAAAPAPAEKIEMVKKASVSVEEPSVLKNVPNASSYAFSAAPATASAVVPRATNVYASPNKLPLNHHGQAAALMLLNKSNNRKAFKVKCSDNMLYRVQPVHGFVDAGEQQKVEVLRMNGEKKMDNLVILTSEVGKEECDAKRVFENSLNNEMTVVPFIVT